MTEITLPSGAKLKITLSDFSVSKELYQAVLKELKELNIDPEKLNDPELIKNVICIAFSSKELEKCVWECMKKALYDDLHINQDTFEPEKARQDYNTVFYEVAKENIYPFLKGLSAQYSQVLGMLKKPHA